MILENYTGSSRAVRRPHGSSGGLTPKGFAAPFVGRRPPRTGRALTALLLGAVLLAVQGALADVTDGRYRLAPGDLIAIRVLSVPALTLEATVGPEGSIALPYAEPLDVTGLSLESLQENVRAVLAGRIFTQITGEGARVPITLEREDIFVNVAEYRPVFLSGDVDEPGRQAFLPGMTVRQAIANAGGYALLSISSNAAAAQAAAVLSELSLLEIQERHTRARLARLRREIENVPPSEETQDAFVRNEAALQRLREERSHTEAEEIRSTLRLLEEQRENLVEIRTVEERALQTDTDELERLTALQERGSVTNSRVTDMQRSVLLSSSRLLETRTELARLDVESDRLRRQLPALAQAELLDLVTSANNAERDLTALQAQMRGLRLQLTLVGQMEYDVTPSDVVLIRYWTEGGEELSTEVDLGTVLLPGDLVDVRLRQAELGLPSR